MDKKLITGIFTAIAASLCCITPVLAVLASSSGFAATFSWMEPFRPYLIVITIVVLAYAWWDKLKPKKEGIACDCEVDGKESFWYSKNFLAIVTIFAGLALTFPYYGQKFIKSDAPKTIIVQANNIEHNLIKVDGMTCPGCAATITEVIKSESGIVDVLVLDEKGTAEVVYDNTLTSIEKIKDAINKTGYEATTHQKLDGKTILHHKEE